MRNMLTYIGFIDETSLKTNLAKTTGWAPCGARLVDHVPFGHWNTQAFIAALRHDRLDAPWVIGGPINWEFFDLYVETQLAPTLHKGDVVILDNLATHRCPRAAAILKDIGAWVLFLPRSPLLLGPRAQQGSLPRSQPDRDGIRQAQSPDPKGRSPDLRPAMASSRKRLQPLQRRRVLQLLQSRGYETE